MFRGARAPARLDQGNVWVQFSKILPATWHLQILFLSWHLMLVRPSMCASCGVSEIFIRDVGL